MLQIKLQKTTQAKMRSGTNLLSLKNKTFLSKSKIRKLFFAPLDDHKSRKSIVVVKKLIQKHQQRLGVKRIDTNKSPFNLASDVAEITNRLNRDAYQFY